MNLFLVLHLRNYPLFLIAGYVITSFLLGDIYPTLEYKTWLNDNFALLVDYMSDLVKTASHRQAVDLKLLRLSSHHYKRNEEERELATTILYISYLIIETNLDNFTALYFG